MRQKWQDIVLLHGVTTGRKIKSGQTIYIWLYRNDQNWLLTFNSRHLSQPQARKNKVNWPIRDFSITKELFKVLYRSNDDLACPRMSKNWSSQSVIQRKFHFQTFAPTAFKFKISFNLF